MSALPNPPLNQQPPEERPRPSRWKRIASWIAVGVGIIVLLVVIGVVVLLHSQRFHNYLSSLVQQQAGAALGLPVHVNNFALHFAGISPVVDMYGVVVNGAEPMPNPPLLQIEHIRVGITISSLLHRKWYINEVTVDHPVVQVRVNQNGKDNLPSTRTGKNQSSTSIFDLGIRHARLNNGEILYNDAKSSLEADLRNVQFRSTFSTNPQAYAGTLQYSDGRLKLGGLSSLPHDFSARFRATPTSFDLERAELSSGQSRVVLTGMVSDFSNPHVNANYQAYLDVTQLRLTLQDASLPTGKLRLDGRMNYESRPGLAAIQSTYMEGTLSSPFLKVTTASFSGNVEDLRAQYKLVNGRFYVTNIQGQALGGAVSGNANIDLTQAGKSDVNLQLQGASLAQLQTAAPQASRLGLGGTANVDLNANWDKSPKNLVAKIRAKTANASVAPSAVSGRIPVSGQVNATYSAANNNLALGPTSIETPQGGLTLSGGLGAGRALQINLNNVNLQQIAGLLPPDTAQSVASAGLSGTASFTGTVTGTTAKPRLQGVLQASNVRVNGTAWNSVRANVQASQSRVSIQNAQLRSTTGGRISLSLSAGLENWKVQETSPLEVDLNISQMGLASLEKLAGLSVPASGKVSADVQLHGTELHPVGGGTVVLENGVIQNQPVDTARLRFQADGQNVAGNLSIRLPQAGGALAFFNVNPAAKTYQVSLQTDGLHLEKLQALTSKSIDISGVLTLTAEGQGSFDNPELRATAQVPQLEIAGQKISGLSLQATLANHVANVALNGQVVDAPVEARARVDLNNNYYVNATLNTPPIALKPLFTLYAPSLADKVSGRTQLEGTITGPLATPKLVQAELTLPLLQLQYGSKVQIAAANPVRIDYASGVLRLQRTAIRGTATDLQVEGSVPLTTNEPMSLLLLGSVNLELAQLLDPNLTSSGQLQFNINSYGQRSDPNVEGQVQIINANISSDSAPMGLQNGNGVLTLTKDRLNITRFRGTVEGGSVTATGGVVYRPSLKFDLGFVGKGLKMLYPEGLREAFDANLALTGTTDSALLRGDVRLEQLSFTPDFDLNDFIAQFGGDTVPPPPTGGFMQNLRLDVAVQSTGGVNLVSRTLSLQANANLRATGTAAQPVILGRVNISGGDLIFNGNRFVLEGGTIDFVNPARTEPVVNAGINTTIDQYEIAMRFWGPVDHLHTNYSSVPALPPADIINLVAFGKTTEASAANPAAPGNAGAQSLLASQVASQVTSRVEKIAGISQLSVDPVLGSNQGQSPGARVTIRQRVTSNLFVTFASDVTSTQRQTIQVQYQFSPRLSFSGTRDQNGGFGFDARIRKSW